MLSFIGDDEQRKEELKIRATSSSKKEIENAEEIQGKLRSSKAETRQFEKRIDKDFKNTADLLEQYNQLRDAIPSSYDNVKYDMDKTSQSLIEQFQLYEDAEIARKNILAETMYKATDVIRNNPAQRMEQLATSAATLAKQGAYQIGVGFGLLKGLFNMFGSGIERFLMSHPYKYPKEGENRISKEIRKLKNTSRHVAIMLYNVFGGDMEDDWQEFKENEHNPENIATKPEVEEEIKSDENIKKLEENASRMNNEQATNAKLVLEMMKIQQEIQELDKKNIKLVTGSHTKYNLGKKLTIDSNSSFADWLKDGYVEIQNNKVVIKNKEFKNRYDANNNFTKFVDYKYKRFILDGKAFDILNKQMKLGNELQNNIFNISTAIDTAKSSTATNLNSADFNHITNSDEMASLLNNNPTILSDSNAVNQMLLSLYNKDNAITSDNVSTIINSGKNIQFESLSEHVQTVIDEIAEELEVDDDGQEADDISNIYADSNIDTETSVDESYKDKKTEENVKEALADKYSDKDIKVEVEKPNTKATGIVANVDGHAEPNHITYMDIQPDNSDFE